MVTSKITTTFADVRVGDIMPLGTVVEATTPRTVRSGRTLMLVTFEKEDTRSVLTVSPASWCNLSRPE